MTTGTWAAEPGQLLPARSSRPNPLAAEVPSVSPRIRKGAGSNPADVTLTLTSWPSGLRSAVKAYQFATLGKQLGVLRGVMGALGASPLAGGPLWALPLPVVLPRASGPHEGREGGPGEGIVMLGGGNRVGGAAAAVHAGRWRAAAAGKPLAGRRRANRAALQLQSTIGHAAGVSGASAGGWGGEASVQATEGRGARLTGIGSSCGGQGAPHNAAAGAHPAAPLGRRLPAGRVDAALWGPLQA